MIAIRLPWLSERLGRPAIALADPPLGLERDDDLVPDNAQVFVIRCPSARFMAQVPSALPGASCFSDLDTEAKAKNLIAWERWVDVFLTHAIAEPAMREADIQTLGPDRDVLAYALLRLWSWIPEEDGSLPNMPGEPFQDTLRFLHIKTKRLPSELLDQPFDAFVLNYRILRGRPRQTDADHETEGLDPSMIEPA